MAFFGEPPAAAGNSVRDTIYRDETVTRQRAAFHRQDADYRSRREGCKRRCAAPYWPALNYSPSGTVERQRGEGALPQEPPTTRTFPGPNSPTLPQAGG